MKVLLFISLMWLGMVGSFTYAYFSTYREYACAENVFNFIAENRHRLPKSSSYDQTKEFVNYLNKSCLNKENLNEALNLYKGKE